MRNNLQKGNTCRHKRKSLDQVKVLEEIYTSDKKEEGPYPTIEVIQRLADQLGECLQLVLV